MRKLIDIAPKDKKTLFLEAAKNGISLKKYIENMVSDRSKSVRVMDNIAENPLKKKVEKPKPKKEAEEVVVEPITLPKSKFNLSGAFKPVEPKIYTNGKCFEVRTWVEGVGVQKTHHESLEEARKSLEK